MAKFSVTEAATAGFGLVARKPWAVACWAIALLVGFGAPVLLCVTALAPEVTRFIQLLTTLKGETPNPHLVEAMMRAQSGLTAINLLFWLWFSLAKAVLCGAVFRAVLTPSQSAWAYLRVGARELWLTLLLLVEHVLAMIVVFVLAMVVVVLTLVVGFSAGPQGQMAATVTALGASILAGGLVIWAALRLSMAAPMTFVDNQFRLFESWSLTKGQGWRLLGLALLVGLFLLVLEILFGGVVLGSVVAAGGAFEGLRPGGLEALMARPPAELLRALWPWLAGLGTITALFSAVVQAVLYAPWIVAHRALTAES